MEQEIQTQQVSQNNKLPSAVIVSILLTALIVGVGVYFWQNSNLERTKQESQTQISSLQEQVTTLQRDNQSLQTSSTASKIKFPLIVYGRPGLLHYTEAGRIEKKKLKEKLVNPYVDYYNEKEVNLVTLFITVPENIGGEYLVDAFFANGGYHGFLFGKREQEYGYWPGPSCMGTCEFSEMFKKKYPQIVQ